MRYLILLTLFFPVILFGQLNLGFEMVYSGYDRPVEIANAGDGTDRLFIVEQEGRIFIIENGEQVTTPFLNITSDVQCCGERGLLGLAFHPDYGTNGFFYVNYIDNDRNTVISRFKVSSDNPNVADPNSERIMIRFWQPFGNHNGGDLNFSPSDGLLYIALGDGGSGGDPGCRAQDTTTYMGKILRIDVNQNINTTPYYGLPSGNLSGEIWALGLRNPWRFSFDRETSELWIADVGQGLWEEVNYLPANSSSGVNFGWKRMEGLSCYSGGASGCGSIAVPACNDASYTDPIYVMAHKTSDTDTDVNKANSITGGYVYRGCKYPALRGKYICTDYVTANSFIMDKNGIGSAFSGAPSQVTTYGEDINGELYLASLNGNIYIVIDQDEVKINILSSADYPLSGTIRATEEIIITDPLVQNLAGVKLLAPKITLQNQVTLPQNAGLTISKDLCDE